MRLLKPNANLRKNANGSPFTGGDVREIICSHVYTGIGSYPKAISDEQWIEAGKIAIKGDGLEQYLTKVFYCVETSFGERFPEKEKWMNSAEKQIEKIETEEFLASLLRALRKYYRKWRITSGIPVVIIQKIKILRIILNIWVLKSSKIRLLNHPILAIEFGRCWAYKSSKVGLSNPPFLDYSFSFWRWI